VVFPLEAGSEGEGGNLGRVLRADSRGGRVKESNFLTRCFTTALDNSLFKKPHLERKRRKKKSNGGEIKSALDRVRGC